MIKQDSWTSCYSEGWGERITPESFAHPAKASYNLLLKIFSHAKEQGWLTKDSLVLDCFGGIGTTGIVGAYAGYRVVCVELESKFCALAEKNFELHRRNWETLGVPFPVIVQGDSRKLSEVLQGADCLISSPPYSERTVHGDSGLKNHPDNLKGQDDYGHTPGQLGAMKAGDLIISSPPYISGGHHPDQTGAWGGDINVKKGLGSKESANYGKTDGQLGSMPPGDLILSSPPYSEISTGAGGLNTKPPKKHGQQSGRNPKASSQETDQRYGNAAGQLGKMPPGDLIVSSPPYEGSVNSGPGGIDWDKAKHPERWGENRNRRGCQAAAGHVMNYGKTENQLGATEGDTFWTAARQIVQECYKILRPGGHAVYICKDFIRAGKRVPFSDDWLRLNEDCGFKMVCRHRAMLVKEHEVGDLFEGKKTKSISRKSFFRRLCEAKGSPKIDWEDVICFERA